MPLKNYASKAPLPGIFAAIQKTLISHKAKQVTYDYDENGRVIAITFLVQTKTGTLPVRLPARFDRVKQIFDEQGLRYKEDQPYRTAWATIRDWLDAQMALLDWEMVKMEEIFLPYAVDRNGRTYFEVIEERGFLLDAGAEEGKII